MRSQNYEKQLVASSCVSVCTNISVPIWRVFTKFLIRKSVEGIKKVKWSRYRPGVAQRVGRGIALLFRERSTRRGWVVSSTPRPHFTPGLDPVPIVREAVLASGPVWTGGKSRPHRDSIPNRPARSQLLYRLCYPAHREVWNFIKIWQE